MYVKQKRTRVRGFEGCVNARALGVGLLRIDAGGVDFLQIPENTTRKFIELSSLVRCQYNDK